MINLHFTNVELPGDVFSADLLLPAPDELFVQFDGSSLSHQPAIGDEPAGFNRVQKVSEYGSGDSLDGSEGATYELASNSRLQQEIDAEGERLVAEREGTA